MEKADHEYLYSEGPGMHMLAFSIHTKKAYEWAGGPWAS